MTKMVKEPVFTIILLYTAFFAVSCKQFNDDLEGFLNYWTNESRIVEDNAASIANPKVSNDKGFFSIPSDRDAEITFNVYNPQNYVLLMPPEKDIISFKKKTRYPGDYTMQFNPSNEIKLTLKKAFLQNNEWGETDLTHTITLYETNGRKFSIPYTLNLVCNTVPPDIKGRNVAVCRSKADNCYVFCIDLGDLQTKMSVTKKYLHKDITTLHIKIGGTVKSYTLSLNESTGVLTHQSHDSFVEFSQVEPLPATIMPNPPPVPSASPDGTLLYYKTDIPTNGGSKDYRIWLTDKKGLVSKAFTSNTAENSAGGVVISIKTGTDAAGAVNNAGNNEGNAHHLMIASGNEVTLSAACATPGAVVHCTVTNITAGGSVKEINGSSPQTILLTGTLAGVLYKVEVYADGKGLKKSAKRTFYYKVIKTTGIGSGVTAPEPENYQLGIDKTVLTKTNRIVHLTLKTRETASALVWKPIDWATVSYLKMQLVRNGVLCNGGSDKVEKSGTISANIALTIADLYFELNGSYAIYLEAVADGIRISETVSCDI